MTQEQRLNLGKRFGTDLVTLGKAYDRINQRIVQDASNAWVAYVKRQQAMEADFLATARTFAGLMGCNVDCLSICARQPSNQMQCMNQC